MTQIRHFLQIEGCTKLVFNDAVEAFNCYEMLTKAKGQTHVYPKNEDGTTDWNGKSVIEYNPVHVTIGTCHD